MLRLERQSSCVLHSGPCPDLPLAQTGREMTLSAKVSSPDHLAKKKIDLVERQRAIGRPIAGLPWGAERQQPYSCSRNDA